MQQPMPNPEDITDSTTAMNMALVLMAKEFKLNYSTPTNNNQRISSNPRNRQIAQPGMNMGQDRHMQMVEGNDGNQFRQYVGHDVGNQNGYNAIQNVRNQVVQNAVQNPGVQNVGNHNGLIVVPEITNQNPNENGNVVAARAEGNTTRNNGNQIRCYNCRGLGHLARNCTVRPRRRDVSYLQTQLLIAQKEEAGIQLQAEEFDLMVAAADLDEIEEVNANCIFVWANFASIASTSGTQTDKAPVYDSDGSAEVHHYDNCYNNDIFNMFTQEEQYTELLKPIPEPHQVQQNDSNVISEVSSVEQDGGTVDQHFATVEEIQAAKFVQDFKSLAKEADESFDKHKALELEIERLLRAVVSQDIMSIVSNSVVDSSNLQTELDRMKERFENCIIKKENEYAKLWNDWYKKCEECKYDKISYDKAHNDMQQKIERLQAQLGDQNGKSNDTPCVSNTLGPLSQKLENENLELEFQVPQKVDETNDLSNTVTSNSVPSPQESKVVKNVNAIAPGMFRINPSKTSREDKFVPINKVRASVRTNPTTVSQPHVITKKEVKSDSNGLSSTGVDNTAKTRRPQPRSNTKNDRAPSASKSSCSKNKEVDVEEHPRNLLLSKNKKHMSSECNHVKLAIRNDKSEVFCAMCKQCLITANHDVCVLNYVNDMNSRGMKQKPKVIKPKKLGSNERLASPNPSKPRSCLRWSPTGRLFDLKGKIIASSESENQSDWSNGDNACTSNPPEPTIKRFPNYTSFLGRLSKFVYGTVRFGNDHVVAILGFDDLQWGNILITRVYFIEGLGYNLFSVGQFCDSDLEVAFRRNTCFVRNLEGVDLLKGNHTTNLYIINLHEMAYASSICLMARATSTKLWLWHQRLSHLNFDTINDLAKNDLVTGLPKFKYHKEHLCPSCESKDEAPEVIKTFLKRITVLLQSPVIIIRTDNGTEFKNQILKECFDMIATACYTQNYSIIHRRFNKTSYELINSRKHDISFLRVFGALWYPKNEREDIRKLGAKGDIGFFIGYSVDSCAYRVYNQRTKKIMETMNVTFDELSAMAFKQSSSKPGLQGMTSRQISSGLDLTYAPSTITTQQPTEGELDLLFEAMYDDHIGGQPSAALRTILAAQAP
ncbi:integrase, catalytic region, zinc finger, CCHC-type containing protein [Tanacetum coccineum]|uniref:Integrase, catalytic region, zinc finger, CCHC-type containing protein n=1 Tax=Tanacetum coccineum TaxID=301880 RepID=A0ABQ5FFB0_9ASTR